jgi:hypothetical protein
VPTRTVTIHHARAALRGAQRAGIDVAPLLERSGISVPLLQVEQSRVSTAQFARLVQELWAALDEEFLGSGPYPSKVGTFAMMCHACVHCSRDLRAAPRRAAEIYAQRSDYLADTYGERFRPPILLREMAQLGRQF